MKKFIALLLITVIFISGCTVTRVDNKEIGEITDIILGSKNNLKNTVFDGYSYYLPKGLKIDNKEDYNTIFTDENNYRYFMYVDVISFYNNTKYKYKVDRDSYYSKRLKYGKKTGYIEINKVKNKYFIEAMYNYAKIEVYVREKDINDAISNICYVLSSIKYNRHVLSTVIGDNPLNYKEETFNIFKTKKKATDFLDYVKEYDNIDEKDVDEDNVEIDEE